MTYDLVNNKGEAINELGNTPSQQKSFDQLCKDHDDHFFPSCQHGAPIADLWYYEKKNFSGEYTPRTSVDTPAEKITGGGRQTIRCVKLVNLNHYNLTLTQLENSYGTNGKFTRGQGDI